MRRRRVPGRLHARKMPPYLVLPTTCCLLLVLYCYFGLQPVNAADGGCPPTEAIVPCRCSLRGKEIQIWCSHSNLPQIMDGIKAVERNIKSRIDELVLENNQLPALPGRFFGTLQIVRLMLRYNSIERVSNGWLNELENSLVEIYIVEPQLRSIPVESLNGMINMLAITIQSDELKHLPDFSGLLSLTYLSVQSAALTELQPHWFRHLPKLQHIHITGGSEGGGAFLQRLEASQFSDLISLQHIDLSRNAINWLHLRSLSRLPNLLSLKLSYNTLSDVGMIGRIVKDLANLKKLRLDHNIVNIVSEGAFVDLPYLTELHLNDNRITEIQYGAFLRTPMLRTLYLHNNHIRRIHPESFLQASGSGVESVFIYNNEIEDVRALRALLDALPALKFLDISNNYLTELPFGALHGHGTLEQLHLNNNQLRLIERDALMALPALRELRMRNNSLTSSLPMPFWNLPALKGLDLALNQLRLVDSQLLAGLPALRRLDLSECDLAQLDGSAFVNNPMLETLNISSNELASLHPATLRNLDRLFELDASYNQLREFPPGLPPIVERVSLRSNEITQLPPVALNLPNLRMLDLSGNHLTHLPKYVFEGAPQLRVLSLANNRLRSLEDTAFLGAQRLELLHLQENALARIDERAFLALPELRNLNLQGNQLSAITDNMFSNNTRLEQLDLSRNAIRTLAPAAFEAQRSLEYLDLSSNALSDISIGLSNLAQLRDVDLSYNKLARVHADVVSAWRNVVEIRLSNNVIVELKHGSFRNLPKLQYLDLSSNEISSIEPGALQQLPELQEFVLADNKLVELKDHVFADLPNLLASHFQYNTLRYISPESFSNAPSMVFLNLSNNNFRNMENIGLRSMRNLEVLDLSSNNVQMVTTMPLKALNWLVELKIDNNHICKIQGSPFDTMPRLRVLSMRNNRLRTIRERMFRNLRGNIAILDVDGNPIDCSCEMQWLSVWLQETNFPYPGPRCQDGRLLRSTRIEKSLCTVVTDANQRAGLAAGIIGASSTAMDSSNHLPLLNEHGDVFQRQLNNDEEFNDECVGAYDATTAASSERPLAGDSEYFYDQYVDYAPNNETSFSTDAPASSPPTTYGTQSGGKRPTVSTNVDLNNTILHTNYFKNRPGVTPSTSSPFTFFGYPLPNLSIGRFFGANQRGRKDRGEHGTTTNLPTTHRQSSQPPNISRGGKVRMYQPNSAEFEKYLNQETTQYHDVTSRNRYVESGSDEAASNEASNVFRTAFREPSSVERGGFRPIMPQQVGGFMPVHNPQNRRGHVEAVKTTTARNYVPVATAATPPKRQIARQHKTNQQPAPVSEEITETQTYYVTERTIDLTTPAPRRITPPQPSTTRAPSARPQTLSTQTIVRPTTTTTTTTTSTTTKAKTTTTMSSRHEHMSDSEFYSDSDAEADESDDLEAQSVGLFKPPPPQLSAVSSTSETILLIPPPEEHVEQFKRHSWVTSTIMPAAEQTTAFTSTTSASTQRIARPAGNSAAKPAGSRAAGGRSTIVKVFTPPSLHQYLPTAEEYYHTTPTTRTAASEDAQKREFHIGAEDAEQLPGYHATQQPAQLAPTRKGGMDWYYESFKKHTAAADGYEVKPRMHAGSAVRGSTNLSRHNAANFERINSRWILLTGVFLIVNHLL